jgi:hypothetical protein
MIDESGPGTHEHIPAPDYGQIGLGIQLPMLDRGKQHGIESPDTSQVLGIDLIILGVVFIDQSKFARIGDNHFMSQIIQQATHPG